MDVAEADATDVDAVEVDVIDLTQDAVENCYICLHHLTDSWAIKPGEMADLSTCLVVCGKCAHQPRAQAHGLVWKLFREQSCSICYESLPGRGECARLCGHTYCLACAKTARGQGRHTCPTCNDGRRPLLRLEKKVVGVAKRVRVSLAVARRWKKATRSRKSPKN
ncbi:hypothetical protein NKR23_g11765 [Pleurostoma richardsiae]|uniref:RING-type domain-containing protein n=1 Tax=Pleurostoma richardsiae TaxID=41990 RepID=A0AA38R9R9_9PEZI|nr:hypothetical protein NKR23_g11765 [Pleurostoma richardsiae]